MLLHLFLQPHDPFAAPKSSFDKFRLPLKDDYDTRSPEIGGLDFRNSLAYYECRKLNKKVVWLNSGNFDKIENVFELHKNKFAVSRIRRAYYASVNWVDVLLGRILNALERNNADKNTIIVFTSDHGFQLGEKKIFCKNTFYEHASAVPLVFSVPGVSAGKTHQTQTQLVDIFPTLIDLVGEDSSQYTDNSGIALDGISLKSVLVDGVSEHHAVAYSQYPRCVCNRQRETPAHSCPASTVYLGRRDIDAPNDVQFHPCTASVNDFDQNKCTRPKIIWMGYSVKTENWKYVEWRPYNEVQTECKVGEHFELTLGTDQELSGTDWDGTPIERELYNISSREFFGQDGLEIKNLAGFTEFEDIVAGFSEMVVQKHRYGNTICSNHGFLVRDTNKEMICQCSFGWSGKYCSVDLYPPAPQNDSKNEDSEFDFDIPTNTFETQSCNMFAFKTAERQDLLEKEMSCMSKKPLLISKFFSTSQSTNNWKTTCGDLCLRWNAVHERDSVEQCKAFVSEVQGSSFNCKLLTCSPEFQDEGIELKNALGQRRNGWLSTDCLSKDFIQENLSHRESDVMLTAKVAELSDGCSFRYVESRRSSCLASERIISRRDDFYRRNPGSFCASLCRADSRCNTFSYMSSQARSLYICFGDTCNTTDFDYANAKVAFPNWKAAVLDSNCRNIST